MTKTRTERRLEKRQAIILLVLVLVVSLATFVLGVMVGRRGSERDFARQLKEQQETVRIVQAPVIAPAPVPRTIEQPAQKDPLIDVVVESARLSFYDDLARDSVPLGSGINQAPTIPEAGSAGSQPPLDLADRPIVVRGETPDALPRVAAVAVSERPVTSSPGPAVGAGVMPEVAAQGTHVVQVGSFSSATDAASFRKVMLDKGYPAFLAEANLGERGVWYRVRIGPYRDSDTAAIARKVLLDKEQVDGLVTRHAQ